MAETMEQYMSKTRADYGSDIARPKIDDKDHFELKGQFLKELRDNTFSGSDHEYANEHIEKVLEIVDLFHVPNITQDQVMLRVFLMSLTGADKKYKLLTDWQPSKHNLIILEEKSRRLMKRFMLLKWDVRQSKGPHYTKDCPLKEEGKTLKEAYYTQFGTPFQQGWQYRAAALGFYQRNNANPSYQERRQSMEESLSKFISESTKRHKENSNLIKEIRASTNAAIRNQGASIKTLEIQIGQMNKLILTTVEADMTPIRRASVSVMPLSTYLNLGIGELAHTKLTVELADKIVKHPKGIAENILVGIGKFIFHVDFIILDMPEDVRLPLILERQFLSTAHSMTDAFKRKITLRVEDEKINFKSVKPTSSLIKRVYMLSLRERMELDLEARLIGETLVLNRSLDPSHGDYIELNNLNVPLKLRRNQVDDLMPTIEEGEEDPY
ncbi:DNA-directed DNA polymerase [Tanacetum coccineum]|uniref:DNA-directed DNA polymerase n=1 Tax=Tanacetum coccineum TaxID=301880 RepID=A0ABQ5H9G8_9ASTR